ncbi:ninjurin-A-like isoform X2 [Adelges cooleyi]|nr:ninjurin-A-like isoform X2 [Adelges cooleyi]
MSPGRTPYGYPTPASRSPYNNKLTAERDEPAPTRNRRDVNPNGTQELEMRDTNPGPNPVPAQNPESQVTQPTEPTPAPDDQLLDRPRAPRKGQGFAGVMDESFVEDTDEDTPKAFNLYRNKKLLSQGMMDIALFSANANQLRYVIESGGGVLNYICIGLLLASIILQILVGIALLLSVRYNVTNCEQRKLAFRFGNYVIVGIFLITALNVFITAFGGPSPAAPVVPIMGRMGDSSDSVGASTVQPGELLN